MGRSDASMLIVNEITHMLLFGNELSLITDICKRTHRFTPQRLVVNQKYSQSQNERDTVRASQIVSRERNK